MIVVTAIATVRASKLSASLEEKGPARVSRSRPTFIQGINSVRKVHASMWPSKIGTAEPLTRGTSLPDSSITRT